MKKELVSVSLKYPQNVDAPLITAKASGIFVRRMVEIAKENNIPVVENDIVANVLSVREIGECIPETTWQAVAGIFALISALENGGE